MDLEVLARYASLALARPITINDPEVHEYQEALDRWTFARGGRTAPGYYLDVTMFGVDGTSLTAKLKSGNELMRLNLDTEYRGYRKDWFSILDANIPKEKRPEKPLEYARVMFKIISPKSPKHLLDSEARYSAINPVMAGLMYDHTAVTKWTAMKPLLDGMQQDTVFKGSGKAVTRQGIGLIFDDTDGEFYRDGVIRQLEVQQIYNPTMTALGIVIEEVPF